MRIKLLRNVGARHEVPAGRGLPEEAKGWKENQVVECPDDAAQLLIEQRVAEQTKDPVTSEEEMRQREAVAAALANPQAVAAQEMADRILEQMRAGKAPAPAQAATVHANRPEKASKQQ